MSGNCLNGLKFCSKSWIDSFCGSIAEEHQVQGENNFLDRTKVLNRFRWETVWDYVSWLNKGI